MEGVGLKGQSTTAAYIHMKQKLKYSGGSPAQKLAY